MSRVCAGAVPFFRSASTGIGGGHGGSWLEAKEEMADQRQCVDWASGSHHVFLMDADGRKIAERVFKHGGEGLSEMAAWLMATSGAAEPGRDRGAGCPVVETLIERDFKLFAINPKQIGSLPRPLHFGLPRTTCVPTRAASDCTRWPIRWSWSCVRGRALPKTSAPNTVG